MKKFGKLFDKVKQDDVYWSEKCILEYTLEFERLMRRKGVSKAELARRLGTSQAFVTKVLRGQNNFTIATMTRLARAIGGNVNIHVTAKEEKVQTWFKVLKGKGGASKSAQKHGLRVETHIEVPSTADTYLSESNG